MTTLGSSIRTRANVAARKIESPGPYVCKMTSVTVTSVSGSECDVLIHASHYGVSDPRLMNTTGPYVRIDSAWRDNYANNSPDNISWSRELVHPESDKEAILEMLAAYQSSDGGSHYHCSRRAAVALIDLVLARDVHVSLLIDFMLERVDLAYMSNIEIDALINLFNKYVDLKGIKGLYFRRIIDGIKLPQENVKRLHIEGNKRFIIYTGQYTFTCAYHDEESDCDESAWPHFCMMTETLLPFGEEPDKFMIHIMFETDDRLEFDYPLLE